MSNTSRSHWIEGFNLKVSFWSDGLTWNKIEHMGSYPWR